MSWHTIVVNTSSGFEKVYHNMSNVLTAGGVQLHTNVQTRHKGIVTTPTCTQVHGIPVHVLRTYSVCYSSVLWSLHFRPLI